MHLLFYFYALFCEISFTIYFRDYMRKGSRTGSYLFICLFKILKIYYQSSTDFVFVYNIASIV